MDNGLDRAAPALSCHPDDRRGWVMAAEKRVQHELSATRNLHSYPTSRLTVPWLAGTRHVEQPQ